MSGDYTFTTSAFSGGGAAPRTLPVYTIEVAWSRTRTGAFTIGTSTIGSAAEIGGEFSHFTFQSIKADVKDILIRRGRQGQDGEMNAGQCSIVLKDLTGTYNPENTGSSLAPNVVPLRPLRVYATHNSLTYGLFFGFLTRIEHDPHPRAQETRLEAMDFFWWLASYRPIISLGQTTVGSAIEALLGMCGFSDPAYINLDVGHTIPSLVGDGTRSALELIQDVLTVDMGVLFVNGSGVVTYHDTTHRYTPASVDDTWTTALLGGARPSTDIEQVRNGWTVTKEGGAPQTRLDGTTRDLAYYGPRDGEPITSPYLLDDTQAGALAGFKVLLYKDPTNPVRDVRFSNASDSLIVKQLAREVGERVALSESLGGTSTTGFLEGLQHHVWDAGRFHETTYTVSKRRFDFAIVDTSTVDGTHLVGY